MPATSPIIFFNRYTGQEEVETVYGDALIRFLYGTKVGQSLSALLTQPVLSKAVGLYQNSKLSAHNIKEFIRNYKIPMDEYETGPFNSFNDFFIRKFRPGQRPFVPTNNLMAAFSEGRYLGFESVSSDQTFPVKGENLSAEKLLGRTEEATSFVGGPLLISRLCPVDYHRFHFPDAGRVLKHYSVDGKLHSVNPLAIKFKNDIFATNERQVTLLQTQNFGKLAYIEVGALCVGKIVQTHDLAEPFERGDEKGYFLFGASTVIVMGEPGAWRPDDDILDQTVRCRETFVRLGDRIASAAKK